MQSIMSLDKLRSFRIGQFAVFDFVVSYVAMWLLAPYLRISRVSALLIMIPLSVVVHKFIGRVTPLTQMVMGAGHMSVKLLTLFMLVAAVYYK